MSEGSDVLVTEGVKTMGRMVDVFFSEPGLLVWREMVGIARVLGYVMGVSAEVLQFIRFLLTGGMRSA